MFATRSWWSSVMRLKISFPIFYASSQEILRISALWIQEEMSWETGRDVILGLNAFQQPAVMFWQDKKTICEALFILGSLLEGISTTRVIENQAGKSCETLLNSVRISCKLFLSSNNASPLCVQWLIWKDLDKLLEVQSLPSHHHWPRLSLFPVCVHSTEQLQEWKLTIAGV